MEDFLASRKRGREGKDRVGNKRSQITRFIDEAKATRLADPEINKAEAHLMRVTATPQPSGKPTGNRTVNQHRNTLVTFCNWLRKRLASNPLSDLPRLNEESDLRRVRRATLETELALLFGVPQAVASGRVDYYLVVTLTGLRSEDGRGITWADVNFDAARLRNRRGVGEAKREDSIELHPQALEVLRRIRPADAKLTDLVFPNVPLVKTFHKDCKRAGIPRFDADGKQVDLHALGRTTFGTRLARQGVAPQLAKKAIRHKNASVTMRHYTALERDEVARAVGTLPSIRMMPAARPRTDSTDSHWKRQWTSGGHGRNVARPATRETRSVTKWGACGVSQPVYTAGVGTGGRELAGMFSNRSQDNDLGAISSVG
jgi:integrase